MYTFLLVCGSSLIIGSIFPIAVRFCLPPSTKPIRWIQNCPPFSIFMLSAFPIAMGVFAVTISSLKRVNGIDVFAVRTFGTPPLLYASIAALLFMFCFASVIVLKDFIDRPVGPYILRGQMADEAFKLEKELRDAVKMRETRKRRRGGTGRGDAQGRSFLPEKKKQIERYQDLVQLKSLPEIFRHGSLVAAAYLITGWAGTMCCVFYFWYVSILVVSNQSPPEAVFRKLLMICFLLITWFPMRVHMDWYQNYFHNPKWLVQSMGFWMGIVLAGATLILVIFISKPDALLIVCGVANAVGLLFVGVIGRFRPEWMRAFAEFLQSAPFVYFLGGYVVFLVVTIAIGIRILLT